MIATAGHVDHGKSTLVRALTGMEPDRWAEERRRGMTIDLGFAWTQLPSGATVAFVDVPGHERFVPNMLAGVGPVPAALVVVAADEGWMPQSAEHLAALDALGVRYGLLAVTRSDLADPGPATTQAHAEIAASSLGDVEAVAVSGATGAGLDALRQALDRLVARLPVPDTAAPVRLWVDRSFTIRGSGTVVTGTLGAGQVRVGDELELAASHRPVRIRALQSLGEPRNEATAVARFALNLRGVVRTGIRRGDALVTPDRFQLTVHNESRELPIYELVMARSDGRLGPQLSRSDDCAAPGRGRRDAPPANASLCGGRSSPGRIVFGGIPLSAAVVQPLSREVRRIVVDRTGLSGAFDGTLEWTPAEMPLPPPGPAPPDAPPPPRADGPSIFTAVQEQLGLKLESTKGPVNVLVIDRVEHPTED